MHGKDYSIYWSDFTNYCSEYFKPIILDLSNLLNLLRQISINGLIAFGMTFIILTGGIDLSVGSILALSSAFIALMITSGVDPIIALIIGVLIGFVFRCSERFISY